MARKPNLIMANARTVQYMLSIHPSRIKNQDVVIVDEYQPRGRVLIAPLDKLPSGAFGKAIKLKADF